MNGRAVADPLVQGIEVVGGTELEQIAFQHLKVRAGITPQRSQSHFPALVGGSKTGLLNTTLGERSPGAQDFGLGRRAPVGAAGDDLVGGLGQRHGFSGQFEFFLQGQCGDKALGHLSQEIQGLGPTLGLDPPVS